MDIWTVTAYLCYAVYSTLLIASVSKQLSSGILVDAQQWAPIAGQMLMLLIMGKVLMVEGDLELSSLSILGMACCGTFSLGVIVGNYGLPSFGGAGAAKSSGVDKKDFFDKLPHKLHLKVKKSGSGENATSETTPGSTETNNTTLRTTANIATSAARVEQRAAPFSQQQQQQQEQEQTKSAPRGQAGASSSGATTAAGTGVGAALQSATGTTAQGSSSSSSSSNSNTASSSSSSSSSSGTNRPKTISMSQLATEVARESGSVRLAERSVMDLTTDIARQTLFALIGLPGVSPSMTAKYSSRRWALARSSSTSHIWQSKESKLDGILVRGSSFTKLDSNEVLSWLSDNERLSGVDGICHSIETQFRTVEGGTKNKVTVRRLVVKSSSVMRSKRDFVVITCVSTLNDGTHIITSRSFPEDFDNKPKKDKGCMRGVVYGSGYILHPWKSSDGSEQGCEISYACHLDMRGGGTSNNQKAEPLIESILGTLRSLREMGAQMHNSDDDESTVFSDVDGSDHGASPGTDAIHRLRSQSNHSDTPAGNRPRRPSILDGSGQFDKSEVSDAMSAGNSAMRELKRLHEAYTRGSGEEGKNNWEVHHNEDGIMVQELSDYGNIGVLSASCSTSAAPHVVKKLLVEHPEAFDSILEGRAVLSRLDPYTHIQYLAYGAIWPIGARDFLLVTSEDVYDHHNNTGFVIASTSIDDLVDLEGVEEAGLSKMYTRSNMKLAGYVGVQNAKGGTDLTLFVDVGVAAYMPAWLLQVLAQYGLSEMMQKVKNAAEGHIMPTSSGQFFDIGKVLASVGSDSNPQGGNTFVKRGSAVAAAYDMDGRASILSPRTPRRSSMANIDRPNIEEINAMADMDEDGARAGPAPPHPTADSEADKKKNNNNGEAAAGVSGGDDRESRERTRTRTSSSVKIMTPPREATPYDHHLSKFSELAVEAGDLFRMYMGHTPDTRNLGIKWEQKVNQKNITVDSSPVNDSTMGAIRGVTLARNCGVEDVIHLLSNDDRTKEYDNMFDKYQFLCEGDDGKFKVRLVQMSGIWPTAPREFIVLSVRRDLPDGTVYLCSRSPTHDVIEPESKGYVRGQCIVSGYCMQPYGAFDDSNRPASMGPNDVQITICAHSELGGSLPTSVINRLSTGAPVNILTAITSVVNNKGSK